MLHPGSDRDHLTIDEFANGLRDQPLLFIQVGHRLSLGQTEAETSPV
jgi:hypothetical protein